MKSLTIVLLFLLAGSGVTHAGWFSKAKEAEQVPTGWRGVWISNGYTEESGEYILIEKNQVTWFTDNSQVIEMPLKSIRIPSGKYPRIEFQYQNPSKHWLVPPSDKWHDYALREENLLSVFCPFCDEKHTFTRSR
jgi:hypothetical protein